jgi:hypothetical protein
VENSTVFQGNSAIGGSAGFSTNGGNAYGGAICIAGGTADISGGFFGSFNSASNGKGNTAQAGGYVPYAGRAYGGAVYIAAGTVKMSADTVGNPLAFGLQSNSAQSAMNSYGGGIYVGGGTVTLTNDTIIDNAAAGGNLHYGGGIYIASGATVDLDSFTLAHTENNSVDNIYGTYILLP